MIETVSLQEAKHSHLRNLFDHTTMKDNQSNVFVDERCQLWRQECSDTNEDYTIGNSIEGNCSYDVVDLDLPTLAEVFDAEAPSEIPIFVVQDEDATTTAQSKSLDLEFGDFYESNITEKKEQILDEPRADIVPTVVKIPKKKTARANRDAQSDTIRHDEKKGARDNGVTSSAFGNESEILGDFVNNTSAEMDCNLFPPNPDISTINDQLVSQKEHAVHDPFGNAVLTVTPIEQASEKKLAVETDSSIVASDDSFCSFQDIVYPQGDEQSPSIDAISDDDSDFGDFCAHANDLPANSSTMHQSSSGNAITDAFSVFD